MLDAVIHVYDVRPRKDHRGVDLIALRSPGYGEPPSQQRSRLRQVSQPVTSRRDSRLR
jgi:hypothetical protein